MRLNSPSSAVSPQTPPVRATIPAVSTAALDLAAIPAPLAASRPIDIYQSVADRAKYLSVPAGTDLAAMAFPADMDADLFQVSPYKEGVQVQAGVPAVGLDVEDILSQIETRGFALHGLRFSASLAMGVGLGRD